MRPERCARVAVELMASGGGGGGPPSLWRTPTPYVFLGLAFMMGVIALALLVLVCTRRRPASSPSSREKAACAAPALAPLDREPKAAVVVMPGDHAPSFLASAKPLAFIAARRGADEAAHGMAAV